jgi:hypothetical protein
MGSTVKAVKLCPQCGSEVPANPVGRPRRFCSDDCRGEFHLELQALSNQVRWRRRCAEDARKKATWLASAHVAEGWRRAALRYDAEADEIEEAIRARKAE